jgi:hypothetical protein
MGADDGLLCRSCLYHPVGGDETRARSGAFAHTRGGPNLIVLTWLSTFDAGWNELRPCLVLATVGIRVAM